MLKVIDLVKRRPELSVAELACAHERDDEGT